MAIISWPDDVAITVAVPCATCHRHIALTEATAGRQGVSGEQAFACDRHFGDGVTFIRGWMEFTIFVALPVPERRTRG